ncbi:MAG: 50S ribosomal protein L35, partial [Clostridiales bacterium]|nr:50S ribosomal protein L35 [Clostridiales bacterium]
ASKKRFVVLKSGKVKRAQCNKNHKLGKKTTKRTRNLRSTAYVNKTQAGTVKSMLPY